jgi:alkyl sulfatase BDS1-like metallo-beta-lactamase superfamily hydrolase
MGGEDAVVAAAVEAFQAGDYRFTTDLLNNITSYSGDNENANLLMADAFEQLGYQEENALYRNLYLSAANELRVGGSVPNDLSTASPEVIAGLPTDLFIQYMTAMVDQIAAEGLENVTIDLTLDDDAQFSLDLHNGVLNYVAGYTAPDTDVTVQTTKLDFLSFIAGEKSLDDLKSGGMTIEGDEDAFASLGSIFVTGIRDDMNLLLPLQEANRVPD